MPESNSQLTADVNTRYQTVNYPIKIMPESNSQRYTLRQLP